MNDVSPDPSAVVSLWSQPLEEMLVKFHTSKNGSSIENLIRAIRTGGVPNSLEACFEMACRCGYGDDSLMIMTKERVAYFKDGQMQIERDDETSQWRFFRNAFELPRHNEYEVLRRDFVTGYSMYFVVT